MNHEILITQETYELLLDIVGDNEDADQVINRIAKFYLKRRKKNLLSNQDLLSNQGLSETCAKSKNGKHDIRTQIMFPGGRMIAEILTGKHRNVVKQCVYCGQYIIENEGLKEGLKV